MPADRMSGQSGQAAPQLRGALPANAQQPFSTMWPSYYSQGTGNNLPAENAGAEPAVSAPDSSQAGDVETQLREREQRALKRKQANRESAKRSKLKRQQAERELQEHSRRVDEERDSLVAQLAAAQQRYSDVHEKHVELRRKIQAYVNNPADVDTPDNSWACG